MSLVVKIILLAWSFLWALSLPATDKTHYVAHLTVNSILQLVNGISSDLQKLLIYFKVTAIVEFLRVPLPISGLGQASAFSNKLALCSKDIKSLVFAILILKSAASSFE